MDKSALKKIHKDFLASVEAEGYPILFAGIPPVLPEYEKPYSLHIYSPKLMEMGSYDAYLLLARKRHDMLSVEVRTEVSRVVLCRRVEDIACRKEDIIINKIKYEPLSIPYRFLEMV